MPAIDELFQQQVVVSEQIIDVALDGTPNTPDLQEALDMLNESLGLEDKEDDNKPSICDGSGLIGDNICPSCKGYGCETQERQGQQNDLSTQPDTES